MTRDKSAEKLIPVDAKLVIQDAALSIFGNALNQIQEVNPLGLARAWRSSVVVLEALELAKQLLHMSAKDPMGTLSPGTNDSVVVVAKGSAEEDLDESVVDPRGAESAT